MTRAHKGHFKAGALYHWLDSSMVSESEELYLVLNKKEFICIACSLESRERYLGLKHPCENLRNFLQGKITEVSRCDLPLYTTWRVGTDFVKLLKGELL